MDNVQNCDSYTVTPHRHLWADHLENVVASTSHNPMDFQRLLQYWFYLECDIILKRDEYDNLLYS
jgi:hypothetical protein